MLDIFLKGYVGIYNSFKAQARKEIQAKPKKNKERDIRKEVVAYLMAQAEKVEKAAEENSVPVNVIKTANPKQETAPENVALAKDSLPPAELRKVSVSLINDYREKMQLSGVLGDPFTVILCILSNLCELSTFIETNFPEIVQNSREEEEAGGYDIPQNLRDMKVLIGRYDRIVAKMLQEVIARKPYPFVKDDIYKEIYNLFVMINDPKTPPYPDLQEWITESTTLVNQTVRTLKVAIPMDSNMGQFLHFVVQHSLAAKKINIQGMRPPKE